MAAFQTGGYPVPPPGFSGYDHRAPPQTPPYSGHYPSIRHFSSQGPPPRGHARRQTEFYTAYPSYTTPPRAYPTGSPNHAYYSSASAQAPRSTRKPDYVSTSERARFHRVYAEAHGGFEPGAHLPGDEYVFGHPRSGEFHNGRSDEYLPRYEQFEARPPPYARFQNYRDSHTDQRFGQERIYTPADEPRPRRASYTGQQSARPTYTSARPQARPRTANKESREPHKKREATEADAFDHKIPAGFSLKNWDPDEEPILLMGSVFDADSLGKWIYDWVAYVFKTKSPLAEIAGEFWVLLIRLATAIKVIEECLPQVRAKADRDTLEEFLDAGERIWERFSKLLQNCESHMWKSHKAKHGKARKVPMDNDAGVAFVEAMWGYDYYLHDTEKVAQSIRLFGMRFDANCRPIVLPSKV